MTRKKIIKISIIFIIIMSILYCIAVFSNNSFIKKWRTIYIETAVTTMSHKWLATYFIPSSVIDDVLADAIEQNSIQKDLVSHWEDEIIASVGKNDEINFVNKNEIPTFVENQIPNESEPNNLNGIKQESEKENSSKNNFYNLFWELDEETFESYLKINNILLNENYDDIYINNLSLKEDIKTIFNEPIRLIDAKNKLMIIQVSGEGYQGTLAKIKDPSMLHVAKASKLGTKGDLILKFAKDNNSLITMNASAFADVNWQGNGGIVSGSLIIDGEEYGIPLQTHKFFGFKDDNRLHIENYNAESVKDYRWAIQFTPALIVDGEVFVQGSFGWGLQPRSAIGQSKTGEVLMLVVDGRQIHSIGCTVGDLAEIMLRHNAYQAMNLDGGSSSIMAYKNEVITKPSSKTIDGRYLPSAFIVRR